MDRNESRLHPPNSAVSGSASASKAKQKQKEPSDSSLVPYWPAASSGESEADISAMLELTGGEFDPSAPQLQTTWSSFARRIYSINTYPNGITMSVHENDPLQRSDIARGEKVGERKAKFAPNHFHLRFRDTKNYQLPPGKYFLYRENYLDALEQHLSTLHKEGMLSSTVFYFGVTGDPFAGLSKKFDVTIGCLQLLEQYRPGLVVAQTRSPMIISALPILKMLGENAVAAIPVESPVEKAIVKYTPGQPKIAERLVAANGLRRQGIKVNLVVSPILPYGEVYRNAWDFADLLDSHADYVTFGCLASGAKSDEKQLRSLPVAQKLAADGNYRWLRPNSHRYLYGALSVVAPNKLMLPVKAANSVEQLDMFAA